MRNFIQKILLINNDKKNILKVIYYKIKSKRLKNRSCMHYTTKKLRDKPLDEQVRHGYLRHDEPQSAGLPE